MQTPLGTSSISEHTTVRAPLGRTIAIVVALVGSTATATVQYVRLSDKVDNHIVDTQVHLDQRFHLGHGMPVGNFDFTQVTGRIEAKLDKLEARQAATICRPRAGGGMVCAPAKEDP